MKNCPYRCPQCNGQRFKVAALYGAYDFVEFTDNKGNFEVNDTEFGDGDWDNDSVVVCLDCKWEGMFPDLKPNNNAATQRN
jgi:hypothetical protein